jgi:hypothetical protein
MPAQIDVDATFEEIEDQVVFTIAALGADPDAADFLPLTAGWLDRVSEARSKSLAIRQTVAKADAERIIANGRLDAACVAFADGLFLAVGKDRTSARWRTFFSSTVSTFIRQALDRQVNTVKGWLALPSDQAFEPHRAALLKWSNAAANALTKSAESAALRGQAWQSREALATALTRERDGLAEALAAHAREKGLPRDWSAMFFLVRKSTNRSDGASAPVAPPAS